MPCVIIIIVCHTHSTDINWVRGKNLTLRAVKIRSRVRTAGGTKRKEVTQMKRVDSFFNFFAGPQLSGQGADSDDDEEEVHQQVQRGSVTPCELTHSPPLPSPAALHLQLYNQIDADFELGLTFRDRLIPNAYGWYTGEEVPEDSSDEEDDSDADDADEHDHGGPTSGLSGAGNSDADSDESSDVDADEMRAVSVRSGGAALPPHAMLLTLPSIMLSGLG